MSWQALADGAPELAAFGAERLHDQVAYLATLKADGSPRLHSVRPVVAGGRLFVFMEGTSPKVGDLEHDVRYALHGTDTSDLPWDLREFMVEGAAHGVDDLAGGRSPTQVASSLATSISCSSCSASRRRRPPSAEPTGRPHREPLQAA